MNATLLFYFNIKSKSNYSEYVNRFNMPNRNGKDFGGDNNHFFSFNIGPAHIISFSSEFYYYTEYGFDQIARQYEWLEEDLMVILKKLSLILNTFTISY